MKAPMEVYNSKSMTPSSQPETVQPRINKHRKDQYQSMFSGTNRFNQIVEEQQQVTAGTYKQRSLLRELQNVNQIIKDIDSKIT